MIAIILCGGESSRFWPLKEKNSIRFFGKPLVSWHIEQLQRLGFPRIVVVANSSNEEFMKSAARSYEGVSVVVQKGTGQAQAILAAASALGEDAVFVLNGSDIYDDAFLEDMISRAEKDSESILLGAVQRRTYFPGGYLRLKGSDVVEIVEKPQPGTEPSDVVRIVADVFPSGTGLIGAIEKRDNSQHGYEMAINRLIAAGTRTQAVIGDDFAWLAMKYPWDILPAMASFLSSVNKQQIAQNVQIGKNVILEGPMLIEEGVRVFENTKIIGPCFIGKDSIIGNNNIIRASHIGAGCVTGFNTDITRSYIGNACWFHSNYIGDSVCEEDIGMGSGAVLANLRLDDGKVASLVKGEKIETDRSKLGAIIASGVRIGVNASIMPGIKIGENSFVGAGVVLDRDLPEDSYYVGKSNGYTMKKNIKKIRASRDQFKSKI